jgi:hypothetical protein
MASRPPRGQCDLIPVLRLALYTGPTRSLVVSSLSLLPMISVLPPEPCVLYGLCFGLGGIKVREQVLEFIA